MTPDPVTKNTTQLTVNIDVPVDQNAIIVPKFTGGRTIHTSCTLHTERDKITLP